MERKYSFGEIESMRRALEWSYPSGVSYYAAERSKEIEERVRTFMVGGVEPQEVVDECNKILNAQLQAQMQYSPNFAKVSK